MKESGRRWLMAAGVLWASVSWAEPVPSGPMAEYYLHCTPALVQSSAACATLVDRLNATEPRSREEALALHRSRMMLAGWRGQPIPAEEGCAAVRTIVANHPDYADALLSLAYCASDIEETVALLRQALDIEPDNMDALYFVLVLVHGIDGADHRDLGLEPQTLALYREALYEAAKARAAWKTSVFPPTSGSRTIWGELFEAARFVYAAALRAGDQRAAEAMQDRVRRDAGLDALDYGGEGRCADGWNNCLRGSLGDSLAMACQPLLHYIALEEVCLSAVEKLAAEASAAGLAVPDDVLQAIESTVADLRRRACDDKSPFWSPDCLGWLATETSAVARLRAVLEEHGGLRSSEHLRVYAQAFLGDGERLEGLRTALRTDPENARARCDLVHALSVREDSAEMHGFPADGDAQECQDHPVYGPMKGFGWGDRDDFLEWEERQARSRQSLPPSDTR